MNIKFFLPTLFCLTSLALASSEKPSGLSNDDNRCFINASLQALNAMDELTNLLVSKTNYFNPESISSLYVNFLNQAKFGQAKRLDAHDLSVEAWLMMENNPGTQQDAVEFITQLLDRMTDTDLRESIKNPHGGNPQENALPKYPRTNKPITDISQLFYTLTNSRLVHEDDAKGHRRTEAHSDLLLPIHQGDTSVYQCLRHFFADEIVDFKRRGKEEKAQQRKHLLETQHYVLFRLKRSTPVLDPETRQQVRDAETGEPITERRPEPISFPSKGLKLDEFLQDKSASKGTYDLIAVIIHTGDGMGGHYIAYVNKNNQWYRCDDENIEEVTDEEMQTISRRGYGDDADMTATFFIYEQSEAVERKARLHKKKPKPANTPKSQPSKPQNTKSQQEAFPDIPADVFNESMPNIPSDMYEEPIHIPEEPRPSRPQPKPADWYSPPQMPKARPTAPAYTNSGEETVRPAPAAPEVTPTISNNGAAPATPRNTTARRPGLMQRMPAQRNRKAVAVRAPTRRATNGKALTPRTIAPARARLRNAGHQLTVPANRSRLRGTRAVATRRASTRRGGASARGATARRTAGGKRSLPVQKKAAAVIAKKKKASGSSASRR